MVANLNANLAMASSDTERMFFIERYVYRLCGMEDDCKGSITPDEMEALRLVTAGGL